MTTTARATVEPVERVEPVMLPGTRFAAHAELVEDPSVVTEVDGRLIPEVGAARAGRRWGVRIPVPRLPARAELAEVARRDGRALVHLDVRSDR